MTMATTQLRLHFGSRNSAAHKLILLAVTASCSFASPSSPHGPQAATAVPPNAQTVPASITNAPFSADVSTEYDHLLVNGNHIHRETRGRVVRDSQGRVRTETVMISAFRIDVNSYKVAILDPVQNVVIHLDSRSKIARVFHLTEPTSMSITTSEGPVAAKPAAGVLISSQNAVPADSNPPLPRSDSNTATVESLGTKMVEGVRAVGTRTTRSAVNAQGEIVTAVTEVWFAPELQTVLVSISDDGESGRSVMRMTNIRRAAPDAELFRVPPDYTIRDSNPIATASRH